MPKGFQVVPFAERFWAKVSPEPNTGCWLWTGARNNHGYGVMSAGGDGERHAHRIAWILERGPIPDGLCVLHTCNGGSGGHGCVNPAHAYLGTKKQNTADMCRAGRARGGYPLWAEESKKLYRERRLSKRGQAHRPTDCDAR